MRRSQPPVDVSVGVKNWMREQTLPGYLDAVINAYSLTVIELLLGSFPEAGVVEVLEMRHL